MIQMSSTQQKVLDSYHYEGHIKAWNYWKLIGNTYGIFLGEVPSNEFIDGESLANHIGLTEGVLCNVDAPWLKFILDGNIIYVTKKPIMYLVSWEAIYQAGAVYGTNDNGSNPSGGNSIQDANVNIDGFSLDVTLLKGANSVPTGSGDAGYDLAFTHNSEWNRLMYPIHSGIHSDNRNPSTPSVPYAQWATYSDEDLLVHNSFGNGSYSWTQETPATSTQRLFRGGIGVTYVSRTSATLTSTYIGWRPCLRLGQ